MLDPIQMFLRITRLGCLCFSIEHWCYHFVRLQGTNVIQSFLFAFCDRASELPVRSPSRKQLDPTFFSPNWGEPVRRNDHFWVRSRMDVNLNFAALAGHSRTTDERICALALGMRFFLLFRFFFCFVFSYLFKSSFRTKHHASHA